MAVAGKAELEADRGQVVMRSEQVERPCQPQTQVIAVKRHRFERLEKLGQIDRRDTHLRRDLAECPAASKIARKHQLRAVDQLLATISAGRPM